ncbi:dynamin family protein [Mesobacterium pallidum]|uniref:dynamin family protein n=1 Tax=Mesobacterium pallidum TaxID=2872037 RepID=UPI001EE220A9|nr:dynamin family protein [Mesobacterium pallidum]
MRDIASSIDYARARAAGPVNRKLLSHGSEAIRPFFRTLDTLREDVQAQVRGADASVQRKLNLLLRKIDSFEASVTLIGQVKAGKTALSNVLSGDIGLLPSDVNPWTSVVTSIHMNARNADPKVRAAFEFFAADEWDKLVKGGGRMGELAGRAGAEDDLAKLRSQIDELRATAQARLGTMYEALLGKTHTFDHVDAELMERYVCLGDPEEIADNPDSQQGRFSDLIKSADIWLDVPEIGGPLVLRDTPGVNDTFMVREQITIRALRGSKVCVVVLSAHEALNTTDLALVRLISNYEHRQVVLFVNRIDELPQPGTQVPEILGSIRSTLKRYPSLKDVEVVFGSARWAEMALSGDYSMLDEESEAALRDWARNGGVAADKDRDTHVWNLSGVPALLRAVGERIVDGSGAAHLEGIRVELQNISSEIEAKTAIGSSAAAAERLASVDSTELRTELNRMAARAQSEFDRTIGGLREGFGPALEKIKADYVGRAREALVQHLQSKPGEETWTFNSSGLRLVLRTEYDRFAADAKAAATRIYGELAAGYTAVYVDRLGIDIEGFEIVPPSVPKIPPPVGLGKTIAVDLGDTWWKRWWQRRRGLKSHAEDYAALIEAEIETILSDLRDNQLDVVFTDMRKTLDRFQVEQAQTVMGIIFGAATLRKLASNNTLAAESFRTLYETAVSRNAAEAGARK